MAERPPIGLAMLCTMSLSVIGTDALSGLIPTERRYALAEQKRAAQGTPTYCHDQRDWSLLGRLGAMLERSRCMPICVVCVRAYMCTGVPACTWALSCVRDAFARTCTPARAMQTSSRCTTGP
jgi:hypothetical protein